MKRCCGCKAMLPLEMFDTNRTRKDGLQSLCKSCKSSYGEKWRSANPETCRKYAADHRARPGSAERIYAYNQRREVEHADKYKAGIAVTNALSSGKLKRQPCEKCGCLKVDAHHDDYSKPLVVRWLCRPHHMEHHRLLRKAG